MKEKCYNHPERNALSLCHSCGRYFCSECLTEGTEYYYCHSEQCRVALQSELKKIEGSKPVIPYVPTGRRFANFIVDIIIFRIAAIFLLIPFVNTDFVQDIARNKGADWLLGICLLFLYYFVFESAFQRTPAKFITGTKVIMQDGSKPSAVTIAKRTLSRFVPFEPLSGSKGTWWHDRWTKTMVVKVKDTRNGR